MLEVTVKGGEISEQEKAAYIRHVLQNHKGHAVTSIEITVDGNYVDLHYTMKPQPFNRIRRITGYLVGDTERWNNAKRKELSQRTMSLSADPTWRPPKSRMSDKTLDELSAYARSLI